MFLYDPLDETIRSLSWVNKTKFKKALPYCWTDKDRGLGWLGEEFIEEARYRSMDGYFLKPILKDKILLYKLSPFYPVFHKYKMGKETDADRTRRLSEHANRSIKSILPKKIYKRKLGFRQKYSICSLSYTLHSLNNTVSMRLWYVFHKLYGHIQPIESRYYPDKK